MLKLSFSLMLYFSHFSLYFILEITAIHPKSPKKLNVHPSARKMKGRNVKQALDLRFPSTPFCGCNAKAEIRVVDSERKPSKVKLYYCCRCHICNFFRWLGQKEPPSLQLVFQLIFQLRVIVKTHIDLDLKNFLGLKNQMKMLILKKWLQKYQKLVWLEGLGQTKKQKNQLIFGPEVVVCCSFWFQSS